MCSTRPRTIACTTPANAEYLDRNYGGIFIVFDRLFGTFVAERDDLPCRYGLVKPLRSNNPIIIACHEWAALVRDLWQARSWRARFACLVGPPEDGPAPFVATAKARDAGREVNTAVA